MRKTYGLIIFLAIASFFKASALSSVTGTYMYLDFQRMPLTASGFNGNYYDPFVGWPNICFTGGTYIVQASGSGANDINGTTTGISARNAYSAAGSTGIYPNVYNLMPDGSLALTLNTPNPSTYSYTSTIAGPSTGLIYDNKYFVPIFTDDFNFIGNTNAIVAGTNAMLSATINNKTTFTGGVMFKVYNNNRFSPAAYTFDAFVTANTTTNVAFIIPAAISVSGIKMIFTGIVGDVDVKKISLFGITSAFSATNPGCILTASSTGVTFNNLSTGSITGYFWNFGPGAIPATTLTSTMTNPTIVFTSTGVKTISLSVSGIGGIVKTFSGVITISGPSTVGAISSNTSLTCAGSSVSVSVTGVSGSIQWEGSPDNTTYTSITGATIAGYSTTLGSSMYYQAKVTNGGCPTVTSANKFITVNSVPGITYSYNAPICATDGTAIPNITVTGTMTGGFFSSTSTGFSIATATGILTIPSTVQGNFVTKYNISIPGCGMVVSATGFAINSIPGINYTYASAVCATVLTAQPAITGTVSGGYFTSTATGLTINSTTGVWSFANTVQGNFWAQYTRSVAGCGLVSSAAGITINSIPGILYNYDNPICATNSTASPNLTVPGGGAFSTLTGSNISINSLTGVLSFVNSIQGNFITRYIVSVPGCGNVTSTSGTFRINSIPGINYTYGAIPVCATLATNTRATTPATVTIPGFAGSFSTTATGLTLTSTGGWNFSNTVQGVFYSQYDVTVPGCGVVSSTAGVSINSVPGITYNYNSPICATDGTAIPNLTVTSSMTGATFSIVTGPNISINSLTGVLSFANTVQGSTFNTRYTISVPGCGNVSSTTGAFRINSIPGINYSYAPACGLLATNTRATTPATVTIPGFAGSFSTTATGLTLTSTGGWNFSNTVQGVFYSQYDVTVPGCGVVSSTAGVIINSVPGISYNYSAPLCSRDGSASPNFTAPGGGFFSTVAGANITLNSVTGVLSFGNAVQGSNFNMRYTISVPGCGNVSSTTGTFRINSVPGITYSYNNGNPVCASSVSRLPTMTNTLAGGYFSTAATELSINTLTGRFTFPLTAQGVFIGQYNLSVAGCGIITTTAGITINSIPGFDYTYDTPACATDGSAVPMITGTLSGGIFSSPTTALTLNTLTGVFTFVNTVQGNFFAYYSVSIPGCGIVSSAAGLTINSIKSVTYNYNSPVCATKGSEPAILSTTLAGGYFTTTATGLGINSSTGTWQFANTVQGVFVGQYNVSVPGCQLVTSSAGITINSLPGINYIYNGPVCATDQVASPLVSGTLPGGYFTAGPAGVDVNSISGVLTFPKTTQGNFTGAYNISVPGCGIVPYYADIKINSIPNLIFNYPTPVCAADRYKEPDISSLLGGGYFTTTAPGLSVNTFTGVLSFPSTVQGNFASKYSLIVPGCGLISSTVGITINSIPEIKFSYANPFCATDGSALPTITGSLPSGYFSTTATGLTLDATTGKWTFGPTAEGDFIAKYNYSIAGCGLISSASGITISQVLNASVNLLQVNDTICAGTNVAFTAVGINTGNDPKYIWRINNTSYTLQTPLFSSITLKDKDVVSVILESSLKCIAQKTDTSQSIVFTVTPSKFDEFIVITGAKEVCEGDNFTYSIVPVAGVEYAWTIPGEGSILSGQGTNSISVLYNALPAKDSYVSMTFKNQCTESALIKTEVIASTTCIPVFKITNLVTPNSSDENRYWNIIGIEKYPEAEVKIYTSWGDLVFESKGYKDKWDGKYKGNSASTATYYYSLDLKNGKVKTGYITVRE